MKLQLLIIIEILTFSFCIAQNKIDSLKYTIDTLNSKSNITSTNRKHGIFPDTIKLDSSYKSPVFLDCDYLTDNQERDKCMYLEFNSFLSQNISYPRKALDKGIEGQLLISFVINKEGNTEDIIVLNSPDKSGLLDQEAIRVVSKLPKFVPAVYKTQIIKVKYRCKVKFSLPQSNHKSYLKP